MRLAARLTVLLLLGVGLLLVIDGAVSLHQQLANFDADMRRDAAYLGHALRSLLLDVWSVGGEARISDDMEQAQRATPGLSLRWVRLDQPVGGPRAPLVPRELLGGLERGEMVQLLHRGEDGHGILATYVPMRFEPAPDAAVEVVESLDERDRFLRVSVGRTAALTGATLVASAVFILILGRAVIGRPASRIVDKVRRMGSGDLTQPLNERGGHELTEIAWGLNDACDALAAARERLRAEEAARLGAQEQLRHADRLRSVGTLASGMAHELGTPLNTIAGWATMLRQGTVPEAEAREACTVIMQQCERMTGMVRQLLAFARARTPQRAREDLLQLVLQTIEMLTPLARNGKADLAVAPGSEAVSASVDRALIQQVLTNLLVNAMQAQPQGGRIEVGVAPAQATPPAHVGTQGPWRALWVQDQGAGIAPEDLSRIFDPFFTTKDVGSGTGLGLSIAWGIVADHGGWMDVQSQPGHGSRFTLYLPAEEAPCPAAS